jgi:hypothetical protein
MSPFRPSLTLFSCECAKKGADVPYRTVQHYVHILFRVYTTLMQLSRPTVSDHFPTTRKEICQGENVCRAPGDRWPDCTRAQRVREAGDPVQGHHGGHGARLPRLPLGSVRPPGWQSFRRLFDIVLSYRPSGQSVYTLSSTGVMYLLRK